MQYTVITPSLVRESLRAIARGRKPRIAPVVVADLVLGGFLDSGPSVPSDEFVRFATRLYALEDPRGSL